MGVPTFFYWLVSKYESHIIKELLAYRPNILYLDFNCAIHPAVKSNPKITLAEMYTSVCDYLENIIRFVDPQHEIYIAIDGVAPKAKMNQQRLRRYKSIKDSNKVRELKIKHKKPVRNEPIDFNMISPGTDFMEKLADKLRKYLKSAPWLKPDMLVHLDDASRPGEGEHKIMNDLRTRDPATTVAIYGLDSDLIFLTLSNHHPNTMLVRETTQFQSLKKKQESSSDFCYLDIDQLREKILEVLRPSTHMDQLRTFKFRMFISEPDYQPFTVKDEQLIIYDYVFICFMLGNDFLPSLPQLVIREGGLDLIIQIYKKVQWECQHTLILNVKDNGEFDLSNTFFQSMLHNLSILEDDLLKNTTNNRSRRIQNFYRKIALYSPYDQELEKLNYVEDKTIDRVKQGFPGWRQRYYQLNFDLYFKHPKYFKRKVSHICSNYLEGLKWTFLYYKGHITDWWWSYNYERAPTATDLLEYYQHQSSGLASIGFQARPPVNCYVQLLSIMPPQSKHLLPEMLQAVMDSEQLGYLYPVRVSLNCYNKKFLWECHPRLPHLELENIVQAVNHVKEKMNNRDKQRIKVKPIYIIDTN